MKLPSLFGSKKKASTRKPDRCDWHGRKGGGKRCTRNQGHSGPHRYE